MSASATIRPKKCAKYVAYALWFPVCYVWMFAVVLPLLAIGFAVRFVIKVYLKSTVHGRRWRLMSSPDAVFCMPSLDVPENPPIVSSFTIVDGPVDVAAFVDKIGAYLSSGICESVRAGGRDGSVCADYDDENVPEESRDRCTREILFKMVSYPVKRFGFFFWKFDEQFDLKRQVANMRRLDSVHC